MSWVLVELALLGGPLLGFLATRGVSPERRTPVRLAVLGAGVSLWALDQLGLRFAPPLDALPLPLMLLGTWLVVGLSRPGPGAERARRLFFWVPAGVLVVVSLLAGTLGALGLGMALAPRDQALHRVLSPTRSAHVTYLGGATLDHRTYRVELRRRFPVVGGLEWAVEERAYTSDALRADGPPRVDLVDLGGGPAARISFPGDDPALPRPDTLGW